ncbi:MAG: hypothetical protein ACNA8H_05585 [Anaerolineales bacterium]
MFVLTGGSSVYKGRWSACDLPLQNKKVQKVLEEKFGTYLLARGMVEGTFTSFVYQDIAIIQSRRYWFEQPQRHIFTTSLLKFLLECNEAITIPAPFDRTTTHSIKKLVDFQLQNLNRQAFYTLT